MEYITNSPAETEALGKELAKELKCGDFVAMFGDLGVGKTAFVRGVASVLCPDVRVQSPTYTIVNAYRGKIPLYHFDMYRILDEDMLYDIGWDDYLDGDAVLLIEWSENIADALPDDCVTVEILHGDTENSRMITIHGGILS